MDQNDVRFHGVRSERAAHASSCGWNDVIYGERVGIVTHNTHGFPAQRDPRDFWLILGPDKKHVILDLRRKKIPTDAAEKMHFLDFKLLATILTYFIFASWRIRFRDVLCQLRTCKLTSQGAFSIASFKIPLTLFSSTNGLLIFEWQYWCRGVTRITHNNT
jgi:hypothetical protein